MAVTTKKTFSATTNATTTTFSPVSIQLNNQDDLDVYVTLSGGTRVLQLHQSTGSTAQSSHPQVNNTDGLYYPAVSAGTTLYNYTLSSDNNTITFNSALPQGAVVFCERRTRDESGSYTSFASGSTIRATDLNNSARESNFTAQEARNKAFDLEGKIFNALGTANYVVKTTDTGTVTSTMITDGTIVNADINASADIAGSKLLDDSVTLDKLGSGALPTDITVNSTNIVNNSIVDVDVNTSAAIAGTKISPNFGSQNVITTGTLGAGATTIGALGVTGNITVSGTVDGRDVATDGSKLDGVESGATADQTAAEIRTLTEAATDSNVFTDADHTKLNGIETAATADQTNAEIKTAYEANANTNEFSDAEQTKLAGIETAATADQTAGEIKTLLQSNKLTTAEIATGTLDNRYYTETELDPSASAGQNVLDARYYTETEAEAKFLRQDSSETIASGVAWSNSDAYVATTAAINARIIDLVDEVGGFTAIANQTSFPTTNPQGATGQAAILSIAATTATLTPSGTTITIANGAGTGNTVTITGAPTIPQNFGFLVESTSTLHTYSFHRLVPIATQVNTVATNITNIVNAGANVADINNFADLYQIAGSAPTQRADGTSLQDGDLWFNNSNDDLRVWDGSAWSIITPSQSVLDDVAIVSGAITYSEDLGLITDSVSTGSSNGSLDIVADILEDERTFTVTASGGAYFIDGVSKPALSLHKGWTYTFDLSSNTLGSHPLRFSSGGSAYNTGVTVTGTQGTSGAKVQLVVPESQPTSFAYYCTAHSGMGNTITVVEDPVKAVADIAANVVTVAGISTNVTAVANNNSNVTAVAGNSSNINAAVSNASNINSAVSNASNINATVSNATNINTVSGSIADVNRYANEYKIAASAPGSPSAGDLWFDTANNTLKNYNGSAWLGITSNSGIQNVADDTSPELAAALDCNNYNLTEVGTVNGNNLQIDFGTL